VEARTRVKNEIHAIWIRRLKGRPDVSDLFGKGPAVAGRARAAHRETRDAPQTTAPDRFPGRRGRVRPASLLPLPRRSSRVTWHLGVSAPRHRPMMCHATSGR
jgi:hypothetical protein